VSTATDYNITIESFSYQLQASSLLLYRRSHQRILRTGCIERWLFIGKI